MTDLFGGEEAFGAPLAARLRPERIDEMVGQAHLLGPERPLRRVLEKGRLHSMIFWGPPGVGKTTLARLLAEATGAEMIALSAVMAGVKDVREAVDRAAQRRTQGHRTLLFIDEVHRFNKAQQDAFLPFVEDGTVVFVGATTENPSFEVRSALLSRTRVYKLRPFDDDAFAALLARALPELGPGAAVSTEAQRALVQVADGDARRYLNLLEVAFDLLPDDPERTLTLGTVKDLLEDSTRRFDKGGDAFYDQISALHKAVRGSSVDGALYWLARMIDGGADPLYLARRLVRMASEDIGNADPKALSLTLDAWQVQERLGAPEGVLALAQAVTYLALAPKSAAVYQAFKAAQADVREAGSLPVPLHLRNAPTALMKAEGHGADYRYAHDYDDAFVPGERYLPGGLADRRYYVPTERGFEQRLGKKQAFLDAQNTASAWQRGPEEEEGAI
ncbi:MAG: replication-associated recombination protein A [Pseudomonadales bacterium]|nr:replication-associated recombination protein A [Pseudomonadales bacterium]MBL6808626.1 replication-associated recombination protein A [Pseudomonadales bacterium]